MLYVTKCGGAYKIKTTLSNTAASVAQWMAKLPKKNELLRSIASTLFSARWTAKFSENELLCSNASTERSTRETVSIYIFSYTFPYLFFHTCFSTTRCILFFYSTSSSEPGYRPRILKRRFALTSTSFKYLDVGITVEPVSYVKIFLGDNRSNHIILPYGTWKVIVEKRMDIQQLLQSTATTSLTIRELVVQFVQINNDSIVKLLRIIIIFCI